jgi:diacylglycerol kinase (ATP)
MQSLRTTHDGPGAETSSAGPESEPQRESPDDLSKRRIEVDRPTMVLLNPRAAGGRAARLAEPVRHWLATYAPQVALIESDSIERSRATLQCLPRSSRVVLMGGDGTLHHMLPVLLTHRLALGLVPLGSGNDTAAALGLQGKAWPAALRLALTGQTRRMDLGELVTPRGRLPFISSLSAGFDATVNERALLGPRWLSGQGRYLWATLAELGKLQTQALRIAVEGEPAFDGPAILASVFNTPTYGSGLPAAPGARIADGKLDLLVAGPLGKLGTLAMLPRLLNGEHLGHPKIITKRGDKLRVESDRDLPMAADGEPLEPLRRYEVQTRASSIAVVAATIKRRHDDRRLLGREMPDRRTTAEA